jgi:hypothetical protein
MYSNYDTKNLKDEIRYKRTSPSYVERDAWSGQHPIVLIRGKEE